MDVCRYLCMYVRTVRINKCPELFQFEFQVEVKEANGKPVIRFIDIKISFGDVDIQLHGGARYRCCRHVVVDSTVTKIEYQN